MTSKLRAALVATVVAVLAIAATTAEAHGRNANRVRLTGQSTTIALNDATRAALTGQGITATPIAPATANADGSFTFPITGGRINTTTLFGFVNHRGGVKLSKGTNEAGLRHLVIVNSRRGAFVWAFGGHRHAGAAASRRGHRGRHLGWRWDRRSLRLLTLTNAHRTDQPGKVIVTADAALTRQGARYLNRKLETSVFTAGVTIGTATVTGTT